MQQQQGGPSGSQSFTSQFGTFTVESLPIVSGSGAQQSASPAPMPQAAFFPGSNGSGGGPEPSSDVIATLERLGALRDKGILSEQEFQSKKAELLSRL